MVTSHTSWESRARGLEGNNWELPVSSRAIRSQPGASKQSDGKELYMVQHFGYGRSIGKERLQSDTCLNGDNLGKILKPRIMSRGVIWASLIFLVSTLVSNQHIFTEEQIRSFRAYFEVTPHLQVYIKLSHLPGVILRGYGWIWVRLVTENLSA